MSSNNHESRSSSPEKTGGEGSLIGERIRGISYMIGNTPLLSIHFTYRGEKRVLYAKAEHLNKTGWPCTSSGKPTGGAISNPATRL